MGTEFFCFKLTDCSCFQLLLHLFFLIGKIRLTVLLNFEFFYKQADMSKLFLV